MKRAITLFIIILIPMTGIFGDTLEEVNRLIREKQYAGAWNLIHEKSEELDLADMMIKKTELSLRYYVLSNMHQMFAFRDLEEGETLLDLRKAGASGEMKLFDPPGGLGMAIEKNSEDGRLFLWLGEYYHDVLALYGNSWHIPQEELRKLIINNYSKAYELGESTRDLHANLAYAMLMEQQWEGAQEHQTKALAEDPENPRYLHNLALAQMNLNLLDEAEDSVLRAEKLYMDPKYKGDSLFLASTIALYRSMNKEAEDYLNRGAQLLPQDYRFPDRLIRLHMVAGNYEKARKAAGELFALYPDNPENCTTIIQYFYNHNKLEECEPFFQEQLTLYADRPEVLGNIHFHRGVALVHRSLYREALEALGKAEKEFSHAYPQDHQVFYAIAQLKESLKEN